MEVVINLSSYNGWLSAWKSVIGKITLIEGMGSTNRFVEELSSPQTPCVLAFVNAHAMNLVASSEAFATNLLQADVLVRDGTGMAKLFKMLNVAAGENLNGTDLIPRLIRSFNGKKIALLGTQEPFLSSARVKILQELAQDSEIHIKDGFQPISDYVSFCNQIAPDMVVLGMGMPKQEAAARVLREQLSYPCLIVCGGAIIDFLGGKVSRAPAWVRKSGLEWVYRLLLEPRRLFKRYVIGNPLFLIRARQYASNQDHYVGL